MNLNKLLEKIEFLPSKEELAHLNRETKNFAELLKQQIKKEKINAEVFVGGSFAKGTLAKSKNYDIDIFVRFDWKYGSISDTLEEIIKQVSKKTKLPFKRLHGSRDYFRIELDNLVTFEIIPVVKIRKVNEARNVTDLSYFHVNYVKRKVNEKINYELAVAKKFFKVARVYGAESYIGGFSGYALECLLIYYKNFTKMLNSFTKLKKGERIVIDLKKYYKHENDVFIGMNESKLQSPIILVDPTWRERNVLAALTRETFEKLQEKAREFLAKPSEKFFVLEKINAASLKNEAKKKKAEFVYVILETNRQEGDIAGTKMKKFARYLALELSKFFEVLKMEFDYNGESKTSSAYFIVKPKKEVVKIGPPVNDKKNATKFCEKNKNVFEQNRILHARTSVNFTARAFLKKFVKKEKNRKMREMSITEMRVAN